MQIINKFSSQHTTPAKNQGGTDLCPTVKRDILTQHSNTFLNTEAYRTAHRELVTFEEVRPASLLVHDATWPTCRQTQTLAGQLNSTVLTFGHVDGTEQRLDDRPTARSVPQT